AMQAFVRVVEARSFTKAARTLGLSNTTVTQLVQQLEARLQVQLLNRTTRQVNVTADGAAYYEHAARVLAEMDDAETSLSSAASLPRGRLRVDVPSPFARNVLIPALPAFHVRYPGIQIDMGVSDRMVDLIGENVDCVVRGGVITHESLVARRVGHLPLGAFASPSYLERAGTPMHPTDLEAAHHSVVGFISSRTGKLIPLAMRRDNVSIEVHARYILAVDDGNACLAAGLAGLGVLWLPEYMARPHVACGELVRLFAEWHLDPMPMYVAYPQNRRVSAKLRVFIDWMVELMEEAESGPPLMEPPQVGVRSRSPR
ncbi:MAG: Transcriptional regulator, LysR family, partial [uncultured Ramlibacter sp.]